MNVSLRPMSSSSIRLLVSAVVAFGFYFAWAYRVNRGPDIDPAVTQRAALVQGSYSGGVTLGFTFILEKLVSRFGGRCFSLAFMTPILCGVRARTDQARAIAASFRDALETAADYFEGKRIAGAILAPLIPLAVQSVAVVSVNLINKTPNLLLTVAPSIVLTGAYGYLYTFTLLRASGNEGMPQESPRNLLR